MLRYGQNKHFFGCFFVPFVLFLLFFAPRNHLFSWFAGVSTKNCIKIGKIFVIFQSKVQLPENKNRKIEKNFYSFSHIELRESEIENRPLFSTQTCMFAQL